MSDALLQPEDHVLSTLEKDGSRRWLKPKLSKGKLLRRRRWMAYVLIAIFTITPFVDLGGTAPVSLSLKPVKPFILLNIPAREFTIAGFTFLPTDTVLLAIFIVGLLLTVVLFTALFGRVWCGWACPQTVYLEFVFRPIERLFDGTSGRGGQKKSVPGWRTAAKFMVYLVICIYLANTFLAYFVGVEKLGNWVQQSPFQHPVPFLIVAVVTAAMMFDFSFFREQLCLVACPYGRFQSVLLDQNSVIVAYDYNRGEPRGKMKKRIDERAKLPVIGDCINCGNCVTTCPTGIDIRKGLQMECINCTQCIDACNVVMEKIGRAPNLIRFSSQANDAGAASSLIRARTIIYPLLLAGILTAFISVLLLSKTFDAVVLREPGNPHTVTEAGLIRNLMKLKLTNRSDAAMAFTATPIKPEGTVLKIQEADFSLAPKQTKVFHISAAAPRSAFSMGVADLALKIENEAEVVRTINFRLLGPF